MSNLRKVVELDDSALDASVRGQIEQLVANGRKREHLVVNSQNKVLFDSDLAREDGVNEELLGQDNQE